MAQQTGIVGLRGTVGGLVFAKDGAVRQKPASNKAAFAGKGSMARVRENAAEFGGAGAAGKLLRDVLRSFIQGAKDRYMAARLTQLMSSIIRMDSVNGRGARQVLVDHAVTKLPGFNFNAGATLSSTLFFPYSVVYGGNALLMLDIPSITPVLDLAAPQGATHFELVYGIASVDFGTGTLQVGTASTPPQKQALNSLPTAYYAAIDLVLPRAANAQEVMLAVLGVSFYQEVNGAYYAMNNNASNPLAIVYAGHHNGG